MTDKGEVCINILLRAFGGMICALTKHERGKFLETYGPDDASFKLRITVCPRCGKRTARKIKVRNLK